MSLEQTNKQLVKSFWEAFSAGDQQRVLDAMADSATWWISGTMPISGTYDKAAFAKLLAGISDAMTGPIVITPSAYTAEGERVAVEAESMVKTRTDKVYNNLYHFLFIVRNGKITAVKEYLDTVHAQAVLCS